MSATLLLIATLIVAALVNRFRGGGVTSIDFPGHRRFWASPMMAGLAALWHPPLLALAIGGCWLLWAVLPWGRWYTLGRGERGWSGPPDWFELTIETLAGGYTLSRSVSDHACLALRNMVALAPFALIAPWGAGLVLIGMSAAYEAAWRAVPEARGPTGYAEWAVGAAWGAAVIAFI